MTATQLADVNIQATTLATSHTSGTLSEPDMSAPLLDFMVDRLPDRRDSRSSRSALQDSSNAYVDDHCRLFCVQVCLPSA
jgi:hypothetical protein